MKNIIFSLLLVVLLFPSSCSNPKFKGNDVSCLKKINAQVSKGIETQIGNKYDTIRNNIKLILRFHYNSRADIDSIVVAKSNLGQLGVNEKKVLKNLDKKSCKCIWNIYYNKDLKPNYVTVVFNPKLLD